MASAKTTRGLALTYRRFKNFCGGMKVAPVFCWQKEQALPPRSGCYLVERIHHRQVFAPEELPVHLVHRIRQSQSPFGSANARLPPARMTKGTQEAPKRRRIFSPFSPINPHHARAESHGVPPLDHHSGQSACEDAHISGSPSFARAIPTVASICVKLCRARALPNHPCWRA